MFKITFKGLLTFIITFALIFFIAKSCSVDKMSRDRLFSTTSICDDVFVQTYVVFGAGATGTDLVSDWLTDKSTYQIYIRTFDQADGGFWFECRADHVYVRKLLDESRGSHKKDTLISVYRIADLKALRNFDDD